MRESETTTVRLPAEIDTTNADQVAEQLVAAAAAQGVAVIAADLTATRFCDFAGVRALLLARTKLAADNAELRLVAPEDGAVRRVLGLVGLDQLLPVYPTAEAALAPEPRPRA
jgi:anti-anti-sigma factor